MDKDIWSGPGGTRGAGRFSPRALPRAFFSAIGEAEKVYRRLPGKKEAYFPLARREVNLPWMSLVGVVANDAIAVNATRAHERVAIGDYDEHHVSKDGYLYAFANDAWGFYGNNHGSVRLKVTRTR